MARKSFETSVADLAHGMGLMMRRMRVAAGTQDLSWSQSFVLRRLSEGPATIAELAREAVVKPQSMGTAVAALVEMGWIERKPHPTDGRQMNLSITAKGAAERNSALQAGRAWLTEAVAHLPLQEQDTLFAAGEIIRKLAEL
jgi:DNA-binding MarR family transcriptional regulator